jgi:uncharacterized membrane protein (UPF0127 family)
LKFRVRNLTRASMLGDSVHVARTGRERNLGLLRYDALEPGHGLWIVPCEGIHTFFMKFAIDVIYLDRQKRVRKTVRQLRAWRLSMCLPAHSVLELPVGTIDRSATEKGDQLEFVTVV